MSHKPKEIAVNFFNLIGQLRPSGASEIVLICEVGLLEELSELLYRMAFPACHSAGRESSIRGLIAQ